ncbi:hypothetical protein FRC06_001763 [Ceratobasidium sp. 370]|nr:hypothetical protein FRC06_001763 [Ceratobasidium sp. 370]
MDDLIAHILQELAFEGDLGSDVSRLRQIISQYYSTQPSASCQPQNVDDKFCAFVWGLLATQDNIVVGVAPDGAAAVYFPPQASKTKGTGKGKSKAQPDPTSASLSPLSPDDITTQPLDSLITQYGSGLRIAVAPDVSFVCITGSHIRPPKLSTNAYAVLQLITQSRREGISVTEISRQSGYDPKACFYFIKTLVELGHIHKIKVGGSAVNICIHKSFYDDQCIWKQASKEETTETDNPDVGPEIEGEDGEGGEGAGKEFTGNVQFEPIDNRHMSNPTVVKARIERLLRHMPHGLHVYRHLLEAIGFKSSVKKERRVFTHRVTELLKSRFIEKVWAQSSTSSTGRVLCIRLVTSDPTSGGFDVAEDGAGDEPHNIIPEEAAIADGLGRGETDAVEGSGPPEGICATQSIASQIISMVEESDTTGMTLSEISKNLHNFDIRSVTNLTARFSAGQPPTHLAHRALVIVTEMFGRERRQRVYTLAAYRRMIEQEGLEDQSVLDSKDSGTWAVFEPDDFVANETEREEWLETFVREALVRGGEKVRERKGKKGRVNPLDQDGAPIKGRPRKEWTQEVKTPKQRGRPSKRKADEVEEGDGVSQLPAQKKRRGRPPKTKLIDGGEWVDNATTSTTDKPPSVAEVTRKRGRPRMKQPAEPGMVTAFDQQSEPWARDSATQDLPAHAVPRQGKATNVSALRRQTEFLQLIENMGGVANVSLLKSFNDEHQKLLLTLHAAGKAVSTAPGTGMDKRTFNSTISALEGRGLVKTIVVSALTTHGATRRATIVHLIGASPESIEKCIEEFRSSGSAKGIPLPSDYPEVPANISHGLNNSAPGPSASTPPIPLPPPADPLSETRQAHLSEAQTAVQRDQESLTAVAQQRAEKGKRLTKEARHALAAKAAQARKDQETRWGSIVSSALDGRAPSHPQFQKALAALKAEYTISPQQVSNYTWEAKIKAAVRDTLGAKQFVIPHPSPQVPLDTGKSPQDLGGSVSTLILQQGTPIQQKAIAPKKSGRKSKKQTEAIENEHAPAPESDIRRRRFPWNPEYDELARDAGAIIRVRCRSKRMDWSALEQVFPGVQRNSVRQRISSLEALPGASEYYRRLDDAWAVLWLQHRGSDALPDPNPDSVSNFDLPAHVTFLRAHVDKAALHAGSKTPSRDVSKDPLNLTSIEQILADYDVTEPSSTPQPTSWDFFFDLASEEPREREFLQHPFVISDPTIPLRDIPLSVSVAQAAVKMTISTPEALYDSNDAAAMLTLLGNNTVKLAVDNMDEWIVRKKSKPGKSHTVRQYTYSDSVLAQLKGDFASSMYADAEAMRDHLGGLGNDEWRNIDLTDEDGEIAAYLQLVSETKLEIAIDTSTPAAGRNQLGWQSKKVADENLEAHIAVRLNPARRENPTPPVLPGLISPNSLAAQPPSHLPTTSCPHTSENYATCPECLEAAEDSVSAPGQLALLAALRNAGALGLPIGHVLHEFYNKDVVTASNALAALAQTSPPLAYVVGYDQARIVSASRLRDWVVQVVQPQSDSSETKFRMQFPRQWLSIHGDVLEHTWAVATRALAGALMRRPSINEYALRQRYRGLFDRQELNDILEYLLATNKLKRITRTDLPVGMLGLEDERATYWLLENESTWF